MEKPSGILLIAEDALVDVNLQEFAETWRSQDRVIFYNPTDNIMTEQLKQLRIKIDMLMGLVDTQRKQTFLKISEERGIPIVADRLNKSYDHLEMAKAWLGKGLQAQGEPSPYPKDGSRKEVKDIEPTADVSNPPKEGSSFEVDWRGKNHIERVDWLRQEIQSHADEVSAIESTASWRSDCYRHLCEARFELGFELARVRNEYDHGAHEPEERFDSSSA